MKRFVLASLVSLAMAGFAMAEEFTMAITSFGDDGTVKGTKTAAAVKGKIGKAEEVTVKVAKDAKVFKGKFDADTKKFGPDGDDLKLAGLKSAFERAQNGNVSVAGKALTDKDVLELTIKDGKPAAKLNGTVVPFTDVTVKGKANLNVRVTTGDDGVANNVLITGGGGGGFKGKGGN